MSEEFLREMEELNKFKNKLLNDLDLEMVKKIERIRQLYEPNKKDLDTLFSLYNMVIDTYKKNTTLYKLNPLKYTDLNEAKSILENYGYLESETLEEETDDKRLMSNVSEKSEKEDIKLVTTIDSNVNVPLAEKDENLSKEEDIFVEQKNPFNSNGPVYAFTNEALNLYMKNYDFEGKSVLASLGSGDFALNAYLLGATEVETFDINQYTYYFYQLKKALIMKYDYEDFCNLIRNPQDIFKGFSEYKQFLDSESIAFFEHLLEIYKGDVVALLNKVYIDKIGEAKHQWNESNTFDTTEELFLIAQYKNYYLQSGENYNRLKQQLSKHLNDKFYFENLYEFNPQKKYDIVYLSNIGDYYKNEEEFKEFVSQLKERILNENGIIIVTSITNHIIMNSDSTERTKMDWDNMREFNRINEGKARLPISNLGIQNVYTTYPHQTKTHGL